MNSRAWPRGSVVADPMQPPPIAEEIDLLVFDLKTMREVRRALRAHRAYTPNDECFFIFLDVSRDFVARLSGWGQGRLPGLTSRSPHPTWGSPLLSLPAVGQRIAMATSGTATTTSAWPSCATRMWSTRWSSARKSRSYC